MTTNYSLTVNQVITKTLRILGVIGPLESVSGEDYATALMTLNIMIKTWQAPPYGLHLWTEEEANLFLTPGQQYYTLGSGTDRAADQSNSKVTYINTDAAIGATSLTVVSTAGMTVGDNIGIVQNDGTYKWTTIATIPTSTTLTINSGLTVAADVGASVFTYTTLMSQPLEISQVRLLRGSNQTTVNAGSAMTMLMFPLSRSEYFNIPNKTVQSTPIQYYVDRQQSSTRLWLYGTSSTASDCIQFTYKKLIDDVSNSTDTIAFPQAWLACLIYNLAVWLAPEYGKELKVGNPQQQGTIANKAGELLESMRSWDQEETSFYFQPNLGYWI